MRIDVLTVFPGMLTGPLDLSIIRRARDRNLFEIGVTDIRDFASDRHRSTDDAPYGGGAGMVMRPDPIFAAVETLRSPRGDGCPSFESDVILLAPQGRRFDQSIAKDLSTRDHIILICGHYEGIDERVRTHLATDEISIGDYVLTGGELAAMVIVDAVVRLIPGVLGAADSIDEESHQNGLLEYPHYTRPPVFRGVAVPPELLSGNHAAIARWRREQALQRTLRHRPDMLVNADLSSSDRRYLAELGETQYLRPEDALRARRRTRC